MPVKAKRNRRPHLRIRSKIILSIYMLLFPVLILTGGVTCYRNYRSVMDESNRRYSAAAQTLGENLSYFEQDIRDISTYFCVDDAIIRVLSGNASEETRLFWAKDAPMGFIRSILAIKSHIRTLTLYPENGLPPFYVSRDASVPTLDIDVVRGLDIYARAIEARGDNVWCREDIDSRGLFVYNKSDKLVFCREIFDLSKRRRLGFLALSVNVGQYESICENALLNDNDAIVVLDGDGIPVIQVGEPEEGVIGYLAQNHVLSPNSASIPQYAGSYIFASVLRDNGKTVYYISPKENWDKWIRAGLVTPVLLAIVLLVCIWPLSALASRIISRPLDRLYHSMNRFKEGDFEQQVLVSGVDEIAELSETFNTMVRDIKELIDRNYVMVLRERESELNALQAQINPHFLYNALDSLYWQAVNVGQDNLAEDVLSLSELFRLMLSSGQSEIPVEQEIRIVMHYLHIQKMRFDKKLDYLIDVDESISEYRILKLILQPFVENAIVHGFERKDTQGFVRVRGWSENGLLCFTIEDNGVGMSAEQLESLMAPADDRPCDNRHGNRYAVRNVKERLALRYGKRSLMRLESSLGKGTTVYIEIPYEAG